MIGLAFIVLALGIVAALAVAALVALWRERGRGVSFTIPGKPFGKQRHRVNMAQRRTFDTAANRGFARTVGLIARPHFPRPLDGPVSVVIDATFAPPASWPGKKAAAHLGRPHTQKPDADNIAKSICDGLNGVAWADDRQVAEIRVCKAWGRRAQTRVQVDAMDEPPTSQVEGTS